MTNTDVSNYVSDEERANVQAVIEVLRQFTKVHGSYIAGGCLLRKDSKDIDVLVHADAYAEGVYSVEPDYVTELEAALQELPFVFIAVVFENYNSLETKEPVGNGTDIILKVGCKSSRDIDFLIGSHQWLQTGEFLHNGKPRLKHVTAYMEDYFPLSTQRVALDWNNKIHRSYHSFRAAVSKIVYVRSTARAAQVDKYKRYYPDWEFIYE